jgi:hypothetical protein
LRRVARRRGTIAYSELTAQITALDLQPDGDLLAQLLDEISTEQDALGNGMLSAVVVHKNDDYLPGDGFFALARRLGRRFDERDVFHAEELQRVHSASAP